MRSRWPDCAMKAYTSSQVELASGTDSVKSQNGTGARWWSMRTFLAFDATSAGVSCSTRPRNNFV